MKDMLVPIDKAGRVVLPEGLLNELAISPGDLLEVSIQGDQITLRPSREKAGFIKRGDALVFSTGEADLLDDRVVEDIRGSERGRLSATIARALPQKESK